MIKIYKEYKSMTAARKKWFKRALFRRIRDYITFIVLLLIMCIEIQ